MDCRELRDLIRDQRPLDAEVESHTRGCEPCQELVAERGALGAVLALEPTGAELTPGFDRIARSLANDKGLRGFLASRSLAWRFGALLAVAVGVGLLNAFGIPRADLGVYPQDRMLLAIGLLVVGVVVALIAALRPMYRPPLSSRTVFVVVALGAVLVPLLISALPTAHTDHPMATVPPPLFAAKAIGCFVFGSLLAAPLIVLATLLERGTGPLRDRRLLLLASAAGALVGNLGLQLHCPITQRSHLLASHAPVGLALIAVSLVVVAIASRSPRRRLG